MPPVTGSAARTLVAEQSLRASATSPAGKTALPALLVDWQRATVAARAEELAERALQPELLAAFAAAEKKKRAPLTDEERDDVATQFAEANEARLADLTRQNETALARSAATFAAAVKESVSEHRALVAQKRDPFTPIVNGDPIARARETVLWESPRVLVIVDLFAPRPKALVIPKSPAMFAGDASAAVLAELAQVSAKVSDAFMDIGAQKPAGIWLNPPQHVMVKQLHVHVLPDLPFFAATRAPLARIADAQIRDDARALFARLTAAIAKRLGSST